MVGALSLTCISEVPFVTSQRAESFFSTHFLKVEQVNKVKYGLLSLLGSKLEARVILREHVGPLI